MKSFFITTLFLFLPYSYFFLIFSSLSTEASGAVVEMTNTSKFIPNEITISKGETVLWKNTSDLVHTVTCDPEEVVKPVNVNLPDGAKPFHSERMKPGAEYKHKFTISGTYTYFCIPHEVTGMVAKVIVK